MKKPGSAGSHPVVPPARGPAGPAAGSPRASNPAASRDVRPSFAIDYTDGDTLLPESKLAPPTLRLDLPVPPLPPASITGTGLSPRPARGDTSHRVMSFTKLDLPTFDTFETAVTFEPECDPLTAHDAMVPLFGQKAGQGRFLFCADSAVAGRYWVRSTQPWEHMPVLALSALEPKRVALQLAPGLMYHFSLPVCAGVEKVQDGRKVVLPFPNDADYLTWLESHAAEYGFKTLMASAELRTMRFRHGTSGYRIEHAVIEGAIELVDPDLLLQRLLRGFGAHRRVGLGMMKIFA